MEPEAHALAKEREANRVLAARLHAAKSLALPPARLRSLVSAEAEAAAWRRVALAQLRGLSLQDALRGEALLQSLAAADPALEGQGTSGTLWAFLAASGLRGLAPELAPPPPAPPAPTPLLDCFLVCGASPAALLGLWQAPGPLLRRLHAAAEPQSLPLADFLSGRGSGSGSAPLAALPAELLYSFPSHAALPAEPSALASFCLPEGAAVAGVPVPSLAARLRGGRGADWRGRGALDCLFERAPGQNKGPRSHTFFLTGGREDEPHSTGALAGAGVGQAPEARTRYCLCLAVSSTLTLDMAWGLGATAEHPKPLDATGAGDAPYFALSAPTVFCAISRFPFLPAHLYLLKAVAAQWRCMMEARFRALAAAGHCKDLLGLAPQPAPRGGGGEGEPSSASASGMEAPVGEAPEGGKSAQRRQEEEEEEEEEEGQRQQQLEQREREAPAAARRPSFAMGGWKRLWTGLSSGGEAPAPLQQPQPQQSTSFWRNFELGMEQPPSFSSSRRLSLVAPRPQGVAALAELLPVLPPCQHSPPPFLTEDECAFLAARLSRYTFPEPLPGTLAGYAALPIPAFGGTLAWKQGLSALSFTREWPAAGLGGSASASAPVGLREAEARAALLAWALPVLISLLPPDSLLLLLGAALTEKRLVFVGGSLSLEALTAAVAAFPLLLSPLHWEGLHMPLLPAGLAEVLGAPLPYLVGMRALPPGFVQDEETIVVLLDCETLRIPTTHIPSGVFGGGAGDRSAVGEPAQPPLPAPPSAALPDFLTMLIPDASALFYKLEPLAAQLAGFNAPAAAAAAVEGSAAATSSPPPQQQPQQQRSRRPCYAPTAPQAAAAQAVAACIQAHISGILARAEACAGNVDIFPEAERPFWARFLGAQMYLCAEDARHGRAAAAELKAAALRAASTLREYGEAGMEAGKKEQQQQQQQQRLPSVPPPLLSIRAWGGSGERVGEAEAITPRRRVGAAWRTAHAAAPQPKVVALRSTGSRA